MVAPGAVLSEPGARTAKSWSCTTEHCWGIAKDYSQDQVGAVSLLARFEIAGIDVGPRWQDLGESSRAARSQDTMQPFLTLQYLYGLARAGLPEAEALLDSVRRVRRACARLHAHGMARSRAAGLRGPVFLRARRLRSAPGIT